LAVFPADSTPERVIAARRLTASLLLAAALGSAACVRTTPELRLAVAEEVDSTDLESGSTLAVRGDGYPVGVPAEAVFVGVRRSFLHPGAVTLTLPARAQAHDRVEIPLDAATTTDLLGAGDDDARLSGTLELRFQTRGAVVTTAPLPVDLRVRAFPRNARVAAEKRARVRAALHAIGVELGDGLAVTQVSPSVLRRGDVEVGDRLTALDGLSLAAEDDALPPTPVGITHLEAVAGDGRVHHASGLVGAAWLGRLAGGLAIAVAAFALLRRAAARISARRGAAPAIASAWSVPPSRESLLATGAIAVAFELAARFVRARLDLPVVLALVAIALFGPARRSVLLALAFAFAASAALVVGGVFRIDELSGGLGPMALPCLVLVLAVWAQRFAGATSTRAAHAALLVVALPLVHVVAPRVGVLPGLGRAIAATTLATFALPSLQRMLAPLRDGLGACTIALTMVGALGALALGIALGPVAGVLAASATSALLFALAALRAFSTASAR
jgi:hypothetical protein